MKNLTSLLLLLALVTGLRGAVEDNAYLKILPSYKSAGKSLKFASGDAWRSQVKAGAAKDSDDPKRDAESVLAQVTAALGEHALKGVIYGKEAKSTAIIGEEIFGENEEVTLRKNGESQALVKGYVVSVKAISSNSVTLQIKSIETAAPATSIQLSLGDFVRHQ